MSDAFRRARAAAARRPAPDWCVVGARVDYSSVITLPPTIRDAVVLVAPWKYGETEHEGVGGLVRARGASMHDLNIKCPHCGVATEVGTPQIIPLTPQALEFTCLRCLKPNEITRRGDNFVVVFHRPRSS